MFSIIGSKKTYSRYWFNNKVVYFININRKYYFSTTTTNIDINISIISDINTFTIFCNF